MTTYRDVTNDISKTTDQRQFEVAPFVFFVVIGQKNVTLEQKILFLRASRVCSNKYIYKSVGTLIKTTPRNNVS